MFKKECIHCVPDESLVGKYVIYGDTYKEIMANLASSNWKTLRKKIVNVSDDRDIPFEVECGAYTRTIPFVYYDPEWNEKDKKATYYCILIRGEHSSHFSYTSVKLDTHIYAEFTRVGDALDWCYAHSKFAEIAKAWEDGKNIQYFNESAKWVDCAYNEPCWELGTEYRVKPNEPVEVETSEGKIYLANGAEIPKKRRMTNRDGMKMSGMNLKLSVCMTEVKAFKDRSNDRLEAYEFVNEKINKYASEHNSIIKDVKYQEFYYAGDTYVLANAIFEIKE